MRGLGADMHTQFKLCGFQDKITLPENDFVLNRDGPPASSLKPSPDTHGVLIIGVQFLSQSRADASLVERSKFPDHLLQQSAFMMFVLLCAVSKCIHVVNGSQDPNSCLLVQASRDSAFLAAERIEQAANDQAGS